MARTKKQPERVEVYGLAISLPLGERIELAKQLKENIQREVDEIKSQAAAATKAAEGL